MQTIKNARPKHLLREHLTVAPVRRRESMAKRTEEEVSECLRHGDPHGYTDWGWSPDTANAHKKK